MLNGDPEHSIFRQISSMLWYDAAFQMARDSWKISRDAGYKSSAQNPALSSFLSLGFITTQTLSIRRLMDKENSDAKKQVVSLNRLWNNISQDRHLLTREHYVAHDGLPYDPTPNRSAFIEYPRGSGIPGVRTGAVPTTGPLAWSTSRLAHASFDKLSRVAADQRSRKDLIHEDVFSKIDTELRDSS